MAIWLSRDARRGSLVGAPVIFEQKTSCALSERFAASPRKVCHWAFQRPRVVSGSPPQVVTKGPHNTMPMPSCGLSSPKNAPFSQRFAGLPERFAARRAFGSQKSQKCLKISCYFSRQRYASDVRSRQSFLTTPVQRVGDRPYPEQGLPCRVAFVLLGVRGMHIV